MFTACSEIAFSYTRIFGAEVGIISARPNLLLQKVAIESNIRGVRTTGDELTNLRIEDSSISNNGNEGVYVQGHGEVIVTRSSFKGNYYGLRSENLLKLMVDDCFFANRLFGYYVSGVLSDVHIRNTAFSDFRSGLHLSTSSTTETHNITVHNCTFTGQTYRYHGMVYVYLISLAYRLRISDCDFHDNAYAIQVNDNGNSGSSVLLENVTIERHSYQGIYIAPYYTPVEIRRSTFVDNINTIKLTNNRRGGCVVDKCTFVANSGNYVIKMTSQVESFITNSTFVNNTATTTLIFGDSNQVQLHCSQNSFVNPEADFEMTIYMSWGDSYTIDGAYNWWGTNDTRSIHGRIRDFFLDMYRAEVSITPIFVDSSMESTENTTALDFRPDGTAIGGRLTQDATWYPVDMTEVEFTIHVPQGMTLTIRRNGTLQFAHDIGILVQGRAYILVHDILTHVIFILIIKTCVYHLTSQLIRFIRDRVSIKCIQLLILC